MRDFKGVFRVGSYLNMMVNAIQRYLTDEYYKDDEKC